MASTSSKPFPPELRRPTYSTHQDHSALQPDTFGSSSRASSSTFRTSPPTSASTFGDGTDADLARFAQPSTSSWASKSATTSRSLAEAPRGDGADVLALLNAPSSSFADEDWEAELLASRSPWKTAYENFVPGNRSPVSRELIESLDGLNSEDRNVLVDYLSAGTYTQDIYGLEGVSEGVKSVLQTVKGKETQDKTVRRLEMVLQHLWATAESSTSASASASSSGVTVAGASPAATASSSWAGEFGASPERYMGLERQVMSVDAPVSKSKSKSRDSNAFQSGQSFVPGLSSAATYATSSLSAYNSAAGPLNRGPFHASRDHFMHHNRGDTFGNTDGDGPVFAKETPMGRATAQDAVREQGDEAMEDQPLPPFKDFLELKSRQIAGEGRFGSP